MLTGLLTDAARTGDEKILAAARAFFPLASASMAFQ
jgi:hypothetical protein